jgi:hypothetical protein
MEAVAKVHGAITDGKFVDWMYEQDEYTIERHEAYKRWRRLYMEYKMVEYRLLSKAANTMISGDVVQK